MSDYELLTVVLMILGIIVSILIAYINHTIPSVQSPYPRAASCE